MTSASPLISTSADVAVRARDVSIQYRSNGTPSHFLAVNGVTFDVGSNEVLGIIGESGSGKSTLARAIAGLTGSGRLSDGIAEVCGGSLLVSGAEIRGIGRRARDRLTLGVGYLSQDGAERLSPMLTVGENVAEPIFLRDRKFNTREAGQAAATLIDAFHLPLSALDKFPYELSSGQRQRVALARALILEPRVLVADEPTRGVDTLVRNGVLDALTELQREREFAAILVSSELGAIARIATRTAVLQHGMLIGLGDIQKIVADPTSAYLKGLAKAWAIWEAEEKARA